MFRLLHINFRCGHLNAVIKKSRSNLDGKTMNILPSLSLSTGSLDNVPKICSVQEQFLQNIQNYFESFTPGKGAIDLLASTRPNNIDIHVDNNDYLHLSFDPRLVISNAKQHDATNSTPGNGKEFLQQKQGSDNLMSGMFLQENCLQNEISNILAKEILGKECVYLAQSGYVANYSLLQALVIPSVTHIYIDAAAHESLWQGARRGIIHKIKHNSLADLEQNLHKFGSGIIVVDSLYSAKGSIANLVELCHLKEKYGCILVVDESHSIGLYGPHGRGLAALANVTDRIDFITGSLAKAYCVRAGFIAGRTQEILYVREISSSSIFSSALMSWDLQRLQHVIEILYNADSERERLLNISTTVRQAALALKFDVEQPTLPSPILCIIGGPNQFSKKLQICFEDAGISGAIFTAPATPKHRSILRLTLHAALSDQDISRIIDTFELIAQYRRSEFPHTFKTAVSTRHCQKE